jgi:transmembrane sensor
MSVEESATTPLADATAIETVAAHWVAIRRNRAGWSETQQTELDAWLAQSLAHRVAYLRIEAAWRRTDRLAALRSPMRAPTESGTSRRALWTRIVAAVGIATVVTGAFVGNELLRPHGQIIETPKGGQERLTLADGSRIEFNTDTAVRVDLSAPSRVVELLRGEAYFEIKHDAARPFVVTAANHRIVDLGTKFVVRMAPKAVQVALIQGSARLESENGPSGQGALVLTPGDVAIATANTSRITRHTEHDLAERLAWQHGSIVFHQTRLADAIAEFNRYGGPRLVMKGDAATKLKINGTFLTTGAEDFAAVAHEVFGLTVERKDGSIILSR